MSRDRLDDLIRYKFSSYSPAPPGEVWRKLQSGLLKEEKPVRRLWYRWAVAAAVLLAAMITGLLVNDGIRDTSTPVAMESAPAADQDAAIVSREAEAPPVAAETMAHDNFPALTPAQSEITSGTPVTAGIPPTTHMSSADHPALPEERDNATPSRFTLATLKSLTGTITNEEVLSRERLRTGRYISPPQLTAEERFVPATPAVSGRDRKSHDDREWIIGMHLSPAYSSYVASHSAEYARNMTRSEGQSRGGVGGGLSLQYKAAARWRIESGIYYARNGDKSDNTWNLAPTKELYFDKVSAAGSCFNTTVKLENGTIAMNSTAGVIKFTRTPENVRVFTLPETTYGIADAMLSSGTFYQVFDIMEIPLIARYRIYEKGITVDVVSGISTNLVVGNNVYMKTDEERENIGYTSNISPLNFSGVAGIGFLYPLGKHITLSVEPRASYYLNSLSQRDDLVYRPWKVGLVTGLTYGF